MKIESIAQRPGGSKVTLGAETYHFKPDDQERHVAEVENPGHIQVLLNISEGYRSLEPLPPVDVSLDEALSVIKAKFPDKDIEAFLYGTTAPVIAAIPDAPPAAPVAQNAQDAPKAETGTETTDPAGLDAMSEAELRVEFEKLIGRKPHANMLRENMEAQITAALAEAGN